MSLTFAYNSTNYVFTQDGVRPDAVTLGYSGSTLALPKLMVARRVQPKKTASYIGNARNYLKLTWNVADGSGVACPIILELSASRRADVAAADVLVARGIMSAAIIDSELDAFFNTLALPS